MSQRDLNPGDPVRGTNPYTGETVTHGRVLDVEVSDLDGVAYANVATPAQPLGGIIIPVRNLIGPRPCNRPTPNDPWDGTCARCGRLIWVNGPYDVDSYTHDKRRVASRYL